MIKVSIQLDSKRRSSYVEALRRMPQASLCEGGGADAVIVSADRLKEIGNLPCLMDQPEVLDAAHCRRLLDGAVRIMPGHVWRFHPRTLPMHHALEAGKLGKPGLLRVHHWSPFPSDELRRQCFHSIDLACWFFGNRPCSSHYMGKDHYGQWHLCFPDDGMALLNVAALKQGSESYESIHLIGSKGAVYGDDHDNTHLLMGNEGVQAWVQRPQEVTGVQSMLTEFVNGVEAMRPWSITLRDSLLAAEQAGEVMHG
ncbi:MAG: hypothetical protein P8L18_15270 [Verrucomicrobiota bacterium]|jgi:predicted dehydrogenase|nr:hypothetical protein [Verrucomicrobiota bacterium]